MNPKVSVIVPAYRTEPFIEECIESILSQTYDNVEAVIVYEEDDRFMVNLLKKMDDPRIVHVKQKQNIGAANARNMGIAASSGELIALCDGDDLFYPEKLEKQVETICSGYDLTYTDVAIIDDDSEIIITSIAPEWDFKLWLRRTYIAASSILFRRKTAEKVGFFREELPGSDDLDFLLRMVGASRVKRTPGILTGRRIHSSNLSRKLIKNAVTRFRIYRKYGYNSLAVYAVLKNIFLTPVLFWLMSRPSLYSKIQNVRKNLEKI